MIEGFPVRVVESGLHVCSIGSDTYLGTLGTHKKMLSIVRYKVYRNLATGESLASVSNAVLRKGLPVAYVADG